MNLSLQVEGVQEVRDALKGMGKDAPKAVQLWATWMAVESKGATQAKLPTSFQMRGTQNAFRDAIKVKQATTSTLSASVTVGSENATSRAAVFGRILARHEDGGTRTQDANGGFYVPARGLRTTSTNPPRSLYPKALTKLIQGQRSGLKRGSKRTGTGTQYFMTERGIFRRRLTNFGGPVQAEAVWWFVRSIRTAPRTKLFDSADEVLRVKAVALGMQAIDEAIFRGAL